ncbi:MAG: mechanosensitive ion channel family protein [Oxalobacter sp.]|nr:MAG: mechanosensitive ion channel family protein [Oxalobacter sp.]
MNNLVTKLTDWLFHNLATPIRISLILVLTFIGLHLVHRAIRHVFETLAEKQAANGGGQRIHTLSQVIRYITNVSIFVVAGILLLSELGISVAPILGAAGVVGVALGFGAQSLVKDYFTGFFLLMENQLRVGDVVEAGGKSGLVEEVTLRYVRLRDYSGNVHYIPNGTISTVTNMSMGFAFAVMDIGVAYSENTDHVVSVIHSVGQSMREDVAFAPKILDKLEIAGVDNLADSSVIIRCRFQVAPLEQWNVRREFLRRIKQAFDAAGIEIPFPHRKLIIAREDRAS